MTSKIAPAGARVEIRALTGLRFVAASWVVLIHFQNTLPDALGDRVSVLRPVFQSGWLGVDLFFLLSGFVMVLSYGETMGPRFTVRASISFLWARVCRIWPLWAVLTTGMFVWLELTNYQPQSAVDRHVSLGGLIEQLLMVQMWHRDSLLGASFIQPGWSLSVEFLAYVCFPVVILVIWRLRRLPAVVLGVLAVGSMVPLALLCYQTGAADYLIPWPLRIAGAFLSGALTCLFVDKVKQSPRIVALCPAVAAVTVVEIAVVCLWAENRLQAGLINQYGIAVVGFPVLVGALALSSQGLARWLSWEPLVVGGRISFALYLVHTCFFDALGWLREHITTLQIGSPGFTLLESQMVFMSLAAAWLLWRFVEEPSRLFLRHRGPGRWARRTAPAVEVSPVGCLTLPEHAGVPEVEGALTVFPSVVGISCVSAPATELPTVRLPALLPRQATSSIAHRDRTAARARHQARSDEVLARR